MKIYTYVRIDIDTGETVEEDSFEYAGRVALCGRADSGGPAGADDAGTDQSAEAGGEDPDDFGDAVADVMGKPNAPKNALDTGGLPYGRQFRDPKPGEDPANPGRRAKGGLVTDSEDFYGGFYRHFGYPAKTLGQAAKMVGHIAVSPLSGVLSMYGKGKKAYGEYENALTDKFGEERGKAIADKQFAGEIAAKDAAHAAEFGPGGFGKDTGQTESAPYQWSKAEWIAAYAKDPKGTDELWRIYKNNSNFPVEAKAGGFPWKAEAAAVAAGTTPGGTTTEPPGGTTTEPPKLKNPYFSLGETLEPPGGWYIPRYRTRNALG